MSTMTCMPKSMVDKMNGQRMGDYRQSIMCTGGNMQDGGSQLATMLLIYVLSFAMAHF